MNEPQITQVKYVCRKCLEISKKMAPLYPNNLKPARLAAGFTGIQLAELIGISSNHYYSLENGKYNLEGVGYAKLQKMVAILNLGSVDDLFIKPKAA